MSKKLTWSENVLHLLRTYHGWQKEFTMQEVCSSSLSVLQKLYPRNNTVYFSLARNLQVLRDQGYIEFVDNHGTYRWCAA